MSPRMSCICRMAAAGCSTAAKVRTAPQLCRRAAQPCSLDAPSSGPVLCKRGETERDARCHAYLCGCFVLVPLSLPMSRHQKYTMRYSAELFTLVLPPGFLSAFLSYQLLIAHLRLLCHKSLTPICSTSLILPLPCLFPGTQQQILKSATVKLSRVDVILITHMHGDHVLGLPGLLCTAYLAGLVCAPMCDGRWSPCQAEPRVILNA